NLSFHRNAGAAAALAFHSSRNAVHLRARSVPMSLFSGCAVIIPIYVPTLSSEGMRLSLLANVFRLVLAVLAIAGVAGHRNLSGQTRALNASPFEARAGTHRTQPQFETSLQAPSLSQRAPENEVVLRSHPTRSSFMATWPSVTGAKGYLLDVSTSSSFDSFVDGYHDLDVGDVTGRAVTRLRRGTTYYYRVRAYDQTGPDLYSG